MGLSTELFRRKKGEKTVGILEQNVKIRKSRSKKCKKETIIYNEWTIMHKEEGL